MTPTELAFIGLILGLAAFLILLAVSWRRLACRDCGLTPSETISSRQAKCAMTGEPHAFKAGGE